MLAQVKNNLAPHVWDRVMKERLGSKTVRDAKEELGIQSVMVMEDGRRANYWLLPGQTMVGHGKAEEEMDEIDCQLEGAERDVPAEDAAGRRRRLLSVRASSRQVVRHSYNLPRRVGLPVRRPFRHLRPEIIRAVRERVRSQRHSCFLPPATVLPSRPGPG